MNHSSVEVVREYGPFPGVDCVHGLTHDGRKIWFASGNKLIAIDPATGDLLDSIDTAAQAGTTFDGRYLFQIADDCIHKIDPTTSRVIATLPTPGDGGYSGLAWAEGTLWIGQHSERKIHQIDPDTGSVLRSIESKRFVTGVTWVGNELWHATWEGDDNDLRRLDPQTGEVMECLALPHGMGVSGLGSDDGTLFFCGRGGSGKISAVSRSG